jgi:hypothetical protein
LRPQALSIQQRQNKNQTKNSCKLFFAVFFATEMDKKQKKSIIMPTLSKKEKKHRM